MAELIENPDVLMTRVVSVQAALAAAAGRPSADIELRVAASVTQLGLAARLLSPLLAVAVISGQLLDMDLDQLRWQPELGSTFPLSVQTDTSADPRTTTEYASLRAELTQTMTRAIVEGPAGALVDALTSCCSVSPIVLWGNIASALNAAGTIISANRPRSTDRTYALLSAVLSEPPFGMSTPTPGPRFRRRSCCLIYRITPGQQPAVCQDCVLQPDTGAVE
jgi:ferric iron reductase protein FhuF